MKRASSAVLIWLLFSSTLFASLGGSVATVEADRVRTQSALVRIARAGAYSVHEILTPTGTTIREFYGSDGIVFGIAWDGEFPPDLRQLFGPYFDQYLRAIAASRLRGRPHGR